MARLEDRRRMLAADKRSVVQQIATEVLERLEEDADNARLKESGPRLQR